MHGNDDTERQLRRQARSADNRRYLQQLPQFRVEQDLPDEVRSLLRELDKAERQTARR